MNIKTAIDDMKSSHLILAKFIGPTAYKGSRIAIQSQWWHANNNPSKQWRRVISFDHSTSMQVTAAKWIESHGYKIIAWGEVANDYWYAVREFYSFAQ